MEPQITVTIARTPDGRNDYLQVMSADLSSLNFVAIAQKIEIRDVREETGALAAQQEEEGRGA